MVAWFCLGHAFSLSTYQSRSGNIRFWRLWTFKVFWPAGFPFIQYYISTHSLCLFFSFYWATKSRRHSSSPLSLSSSPLSTTLRFPSLSIHPTHTHHFWHKWTAIHRYDIIRLHAMHISTLWTVKISTWLISFATHPTHSPTSDPRVLSHHPIPWRHCLVWKRSLQTIHLTTTQRTSVSHARMQWKILERHQTD